MKPLISLLDASFHCVNLGAARVRRRRRAVMCGPQVNSVLPDYAITLVMPLNMVPGHDQIIGSVIKVSTLLLLRSHLSLAKHRTYGLMELYEGEKSRKGLREERRAFGSIQSMTRGRRQGGATGEQPVHTGPGLRCMSALWAECFVKQSTQNQLLIMTSSSLINTV